MRRECSIVIHANGRLKISKQSFDIPKMKKRGERAEDLAWYYNRYDQLNKERIKETLEILLDGD